MFSVQQLENENLNLDSECILRRHIQGGLGHKKPSPQTTLFIPYLQV